MLHHLQLDVFVINMKIRVNLPTRDRNTIFSSARSRIQNKKVIRIVKSFYIVK